MAFRFIEISKYDDGSQIMPAAKLCLKAVIVLIACHLKIWLKKKIDLRLQIYKC